MAVKEVIFVPKEKSKELILATFGKFFEPKKNQEIQLESTKFTRSIKLIQGKSSYKGRIRRLGENNEFIFHETEKNIFVYELDFSAQMQKEET